MVFYSITLTANCSMRPLADLHEVGTTALTNKMRPNFFFEDEYYPCQLALGETLNAGSEGTVELQLIPAVPLDIKPGDQFELRAAVATLAYCVVNEVREVKEINA